MKKEVQQKKPQIIQLFEKENPTIDYSKLRIVKNDCGPDCNPDTTSLIAGNCNDCCSNCCKSGHRGGCCNNCDCQECCNSCCDKCYDSICNSCQEKCSCCDCCCKDVEITNPETIPFTQEQVELFEKIMSEQLNSLEMKEDSLQKLLEENPNLDSLTTELEKINKQKEEIQKQLDSFKR